MGRTAVTTGKMLGGAPTYDDRWLYISRDAGDWLPTYSAYDTAAHGRLMNARMINSAWNNISATYSSFDEAANTADFIAHLEEYLSYGMLGVTVGLQGGNIGNSQTAGDATAFNDDGSADLDGGTFTNPGTGSWWWRLAQIIEAADELGMLVIVNPIYFGQDEHLNDNNACRAVMEQTAEFILQNDYRNVLVDCVNEWTGDQYNHSILNTNSNPNGVPELIQIVQDWFTGQPWRPPVGASLGSVGSSAGHTGAIATQADVVFPHGNGSSASQVAAGMAWHIANQDYPVVMNEDHADDHNYTPSQAVTQTFLDRELDGMQECWDAGGSWGLMLFGYNQSFPFEWDVGASADISGGSEENYFRAVLDGMHALVGDPTEALDSEYSNVAGATTAGGPNSISGLHIASTFTLHAPVLQTTYFTDFADNTPAGAPADWSAGWGTLSKTVTVENTGLPADAGLQALKISGGSGGRYALKWDLPLTPAGDAGVLARMQRSADVDNAMRLMLAGSGAAGSETAYVLSLRGGVVNTLHLLAFEDGIATDIQQIAFTVQENAWYWLELERSGTTLRGRAWLDGEGPPDWLVSGLGDALGAGWVAVGDSAGSGDLWISQAGLGVGGLAAPSTGGVVIDSAYSNVADATTAGGGLIAAAHLGSTFTLHAAALDPGGVSLPAAHLASTFTLWPATLESGKLIEGAHIESTFTLYNAELIAPFIVQVAPVIRAAPIFRLAIYAPLSSGRDERVDVADINANVHSLTWTNMLPGGFGDLEVGREAVYSINGRQVAFNRLPQRLQCQPFNHVQLWGGSALLYEGRLGAYRRPETQFAARGYWSALSDSDFESTSTTATTSGAALTSVLASAAPLVSPAAGDDFQDPQVTHTPSDFDRMRPLAVLDQIVNEGNAQGRMMDWAVWEGRRLHLTQRVAPHHPDYQITHDDTVVDWFEDPDELRSAVALEFTATAFGTATVAAANVSVSVAHNLGFTPDSKQIKITSLSGIGAAKHVFVSSISSSNFQITLDVAPGVPVSFAWIIEAPGTLTDWTENATFVSRWEVIKRQIVKGGKLTLAAAERIRDTVLEESQQPRISVLIERPFDRPLSGPHGEPRSPWLARGGRWIAVGESEPLIIVRVVVNANTRMVRITAGSSPPTWQTLLGRLQRDTEARRLGLNPVSGGRAT